MTNAKWKVVVLLTILIAPSFLLTQKPNIQASLTDDWPMFRHDPSHLGATGSIGPMAPEKLWTFTEGHFDGSFIGSSAAVVNGIVYVGSNYNAFDKRGNSIYALDAHTGEKIWNYSTDGSIHSSPAISENKLFIGVGSNVCAFDAMTGLQLWSFQTDGGVESSPAVADEVVYVGSFDNNIYALNASTGIKIWNYSTQDLVQSSPAVFMGTVYVGSDDGNIYALNSSTGEKIWSYKTIYPVSSSPAVDNGVVYIGSVDGNLYALNTSTGNQIWAFSSQPTRYYSGGYNGGVQASPAVVNGKVYIASMDSNIYALDASNGNQIWNYTVPSFYGPLLSSAAFSDNIVYVGAGRTLLALNGTSGAQVWFFDTQNTINASPAIFNGIVYIASQDGNFYALGRPLGEPTSVPVIETQTLGILITILTIVIILIITLTFRKKKSVTINN
jgi:eukaryotic-like serine/threonine-protein kinase